MPEPMTVIYEFSIAEIDALNALYTAINTVRANHSSIDIRITSRQKETLELPVESIITIAAKGAANSNFDASEVIQAAKEINDLLPGEAIS